MVIWIGFSRNAFSTRVTGQHPFCHVIDGTRCPYDTSKICESKIRHLQQNPCHEGVHRQHNGVWLQFKRTLCGFKPNDYLEYTPDSLVCEYAAQIQTIPSTDQLVGATLTKPTSQQLMHLLWTRTLRCSLDPDALYLGRVWPAVLLS